MTVVGYLKPSYVQVIFVADDLVGDYTIYNVYPEDIEFVSYNKIFRKCLLNSYYF